MMMLLFAGKYTALSECLVMAQAINQKFFSMHCCMAFVQIQLNWRVFLLEQEKQRKGITCHAFKGGAKVT